MSAGVDLRAHLHICVGLPGCPAARLGGGTWKAAVLPTPSSSAVMRLLDEAGEIGEFGGGSLEQPRPWLGPHWLGPLPWECRAARGHQARPEEVQEPSSGAAKGGTLTMLDTPPSVIGWALVAKLPSSESPVADASGSSMLRARWAGGGKAAAVAASASAAVALALAAAAAA